MDFWYGMDVLEERKCPVLIGNRNKIPVRSAPQP